VVDTTGCRVVVSCFVTLEDPLVDVVSATLVAIDVPVDFVIVAVVEDTTVDGGIVDETVVGSIVEIDAAVLSDVETFVGVIVRVDIVSVDDALVDTPLKVVGSALVDVTGTGEDVNAMVVEELPSEVGVVGVANEVSDVAEGVPDSCSAVFDATGGIVVVSASEVLDKTLLDVVGIDIVPAVDALEETPVDVVCAARVDVDASEAVVDGLLVVDSPLAVCVVDDTEAVGRSVVTVGVVVLVSA